MPGLVRVMKILVASRHPSAILPKSTLDLFSSMFGSSSLLKEWLVVLELTKVDDKWLLGCVLSWFTELELRLELSTFWLTYKKIEMIKYE